MEGKLKLSFRVVELVKSKRILMPKFRTRKLYYLLQNELKVLKVGRSTENTMYINRNI
jgi:hypothetical protein